MKNKQAQKARMRRKGEESRYVYGHERIGLCSVCGREQYVTTEGRPGNHKDLRSGAASADSPTCEGSQQRALASPVYRADISGRSIANFRLRSMRATDARYTRRYREKRKSTE